MSIMSRLNREIRGVLKLYVPELWEKLHYRQIYGSICNLENPTTFSEKLLWLKINKYRNNETIVRLSNKYSVREYVSSKGYSDLLNDLYFVYNNSQELVYDDLPESFALKSSVGCGKNFFCKDKRKCSKERLIAIIKKWEKDPIRYDLNEVDLDVKHKNLLNRSYLCEKYLEVNNKPPVDYKIYCFNGKPMAILYITDRFEGKRKKGAFFSTEWEYISVAGKKYDDFNTLPQKPKSLGKMLQAAENLAGNFPFVRIDFYEVEEKPIFGEMTFFPSGSVGVSETLIGEKTMGELIKLY